jgi:hypothetical protein
MMELSESHASVLAAFVKAQGEMRPAVKGSANPHFRSKYADLSECLEVIREAYAPNGLAFVQSASVDDRGLLCIVSTTVHTSGEWMRTTVHVPIDKNTSQGAGSAISYGRRYGAKLHVGMAEEDDDGQAASRGAQPAAQAPPPAQTYQSLADAPQSSEDKMCSEKQAGKIRWLAMRKGVTAKLPGMLKERFGVGEPEMLNSKQASSVIDGLDTMPDAEGTPK